MKKRNPVNYIDNKQFQRMLIEYKQSVADAEKEGKEIPIITDEIGRAIQQISRGISTKKNFSDYPFKEEMILDGIENAIRAVDTFDPVKYDNPFAYFTMVIINAFIRRIQNEKKVLYTKYKFIEKAMISDELAHNTTAIHLSINLDTEYMKEFIRTYEESQRRKKEKAAEAKAMRDEMKERENNEICSDN